MNTSSAGRNYRPLGRLLRVATSLFVFATLGASLAQAQAPSSGSGSVSGSVSSASTKNALQGATVTIPSLNRTVLTDEAGRFVIPDVPAGPVEVVVTYAGMTEGRQSVVVGSGAPASVDLQLKSSEILTMEKFTVESVKEGQALALTQQKNALNIKNVTAFDEWGVLPTQNVGELLTRLPGLAVAQMDEDGLIMSVSIGGQPGGNAGYTRLNIDGMASTGVGGDGRTATLHSFSAAMYEQVEVIAGQTPDKRADGLGGQLNLVTASPLALTTKRRVDFTASGRWFPSWSDRNDMLSHHALRPDLSLTYREVFDVGGKRKNLGIMIGASYQEVVNPHDFNILLYQNSVLPNAWLQDYQRSSGINDRFIKGVNARVDYRISESTKISVRLLYNGGSEPFFQYAHVNPFASTNLTVYNPSAPSATASIMPGYTSSRTEFRPTTTASAGVQVGAARMRLNPWKVSFTSKNPTGTVALDHNWGRLKVDHAYRWSHTHWDSNAGRNRENGELQLRTRDAIGFVLDYSDPEGQVFTQTAGPSVYNAASYTPFVVTARNTSTQPTDQTSAAFIKRDSVTDTNEVSATVNAAYLLPTETPITIKTGLDTVNRRVNARSPFARRWYGVVDSVLPSTLGLVPLTEFERQHGGQRLPIFDPASVSTTLTNTSLWTEDVNYNAVERFRTSRIMEEGVDAAYLQAQAKFGRFTILGGGRNEWVSTETFFYVAASAANRTTVAAEPDPLKRAIRDYTPSSIDGSYSKFFPSVHLAYDVTANLKLRASWSNSYGRPRLQDMVASPTATDVASGTNFPGTITIGNPDLKPALAENMDFRVDYSIGRNSFFSARVFRKDIDDYIGSARNLGERVPDGADNGYGGQYVGYYLIEPVNLGTTLSKGFELDYRQRLSFLPGALKGLFLRANYTNVRTSAVFNGIAYNPGQVVGSAGQWYVPRTYNVGLQYFYRKFGANVDYNYTAQFPTVYSHTSLGSNVFRRSREIINAGVSYQVRPELTVFVNVNNITETRAESYTSLEDRHRQFFVMPQSIKFGLTGRF